MAIVIKEMKAASSIENEIQMLRSKDWVIRLRCREKETVMAMAIKENVSSLLAMM